MADHSKIEWTDATWNPVTGCSVVSPGCTNCYAMKLAGTRLKHHPSRAGLTKPSKAGPVWTGEVRFNEEWLTQPLRWKEPRDIFVCAHGDLFHESVPDEWIDRVFAVMTLCPQHRFQVLTKRARRGREYFTFDERWKRVCAAVPTSFIRWPLPNVWLGVSAEDQANWDARKDDLRNTPATVRFASFEPLLGPIVEPHMADFIQWAIVGGESGPRARPMHPKWERAIRYQCKGSGIAYFGKQWGEWGPLDSGNPRHQDVPYGHWHGNEFVRSCLCIEGTDAMARVGKKAAGRLLDGVRYDGMPAAADVQPGRPI